MPRFALGRDRERRRLLGVERTEPLQERAGSLELDGLADDVGDRELRLDLGGDAG
jgi:hypothetical protein